MYMYIYVYIYIHIHIIFFNIACASYIQVRLSVINISKTAGETCVNDNKKKPITITNPI